MPTPMDADTTRTPARDAATDRREADDLEQALRPVAPRAVPLRAVTEAVRSLRVSTGVDGVVVTGASIDSRTVRAGDIYVAAPGARVHGARFTRDAAARGAVAVVTDEAGADIAADSGLPVVVVNEVRSVIGDVAAAAYGTTERAPRLFGVTGTNGKTTTTYLLRSLLEALDHPTGLVGTVEIDAGNGPVPSVRTTPEATALHGILARMTEEKLHSASVEVSSHALSYRRVDALRFAVAGFSNLTPDHLDVHGDMAGYFEAKARLFSPILAERGVVCVDDRWGRHLARTADIPIVTLQTREPLDDPRDVDHLLPSDEIDADYTVTDVVRIGIGIGHGFVLRRDGESVLRATTALPGAFNVSNAALALVMVLESGVSAERVQEAIDRPQTLSPLVPGRMQVITTDPTTVVDFAHNAAALQAALMSVNGTAGRTIVVFGAPGERDTAKRAMMGAMGARYSDVAIITDDDPHGEDAASIRAQVLSGARMAEQPGSLVVEIPSRTDAIAAAVAMARPDDIVLVAGRGHETVQDVDGAQIPLDDAEELRRAVSRR
ncbi:UDP-N-acetylmuramyl-tripeptide synthetase [Microbacterium sp. ZW T5_56]|uniref:Mur ligase family protein n=1 Tax=Microbacterium sp. ZW T5_56 TaxID=3378081 RepID=UPI0038528C53